MDFAVVSVVGCLLVTFITALFLMACVKWSAAEQQQRGEMYTARESFRVEYDGDEEDLHTCTVCGTQYLTIDDLVGLKSAEGFSLKRCTLLHCRLYTYQKDILKYSIKMVAHE